MQHKIDGFVISDTDPLRQMKLIEEIRKLDSKRDLILISQGGVRSGKDALARIKAGADLVQIYTPIVVEGPKVVGNMLLEM